MSNITLGSIKSALFFVGKWWLIFELLKFTVAAVVVAFFALTYPQKVLDFTTHGTMPWQEVQR